MDYELAKQLKDAGFPQDVDGLGKGIWLYPTETAANGMYAPTLEELIEECGDEFSNVERYNTPGGYFICHDSEDRAYSGSTLREALARLYLALNKK